jgi:hypothetical protein
MSYGAVQLDEQFLRQQRLGRFVATFNERFRQKWPVMAYITPLREPIVIGSYITGQPAVALDDVVILYTPLLVLQEVGEAQAVGLYPYTSVRGSGIAFGRGFTRLSPRQLVEVDSSNFVVNADQVYMRADGSLSVHGGMFNAAVEQIYIRADNNLEARASGTYMYIRDRRLYISAERIDMDTFASVRSLDVQDTLRVFGPFYLKYLDTVYRVYVDESGYLRAVKVTL